MEIWVFSCLPFLTLCNPKPSKPPQPMHDFQSLVLPLVNANGKVSLSRLLQPLYSMFEEEEEEAEEQEEYELSAEELVEEVAEEEREKCEESLATAFKFFDRDGDGFISAEDLRVALEGVMVGEEDRCWGGEECEEMVRAFDKKRIGGVCFDDFVSMLIYT